MKAVVLGAGGFIGHHLVKYLKGKGYWVRGVDLKYPEFENTQADEFLILDLRGYGECFDATVGMEEVYNLAADVGGIGYLSKYQSVILANNNKINTFILPASYNNNVKKYFFSSSSCVYPTYLQASGMPIIEESVLPAQPHDAYGWEKLFHEKMCEYTSIDLDIQTRIARFFNVYGEMDVWQGGKEKSVAALCRKVADAKLNGKNEIDVWGDGRQSRCYIHVDDCVEGIYRIMQSDYGKPLNLSNDNPVTIDNLIDVICNVANWKVINKYNINEPIGSRFRNSDSSMVRNKLDWKARVSIEDGIARTYNWVEEQVKNEREEKVILPVINNIFALEKKEDKQ